MEKEPYKYESVKEAGLEVGKEITLYATDTNPNILYYKEDLETGAMAKSMFAHFIMAVVSGGIVIGILVAEILCFSGISNK